MTESRLLGYVRKNKDGLKVSISETAFSQAPRYESATGERYVGMVINLNKLRDLLSGEREVTSVCAKEVE